jgi:hypothetical protein
MSIDTGFERGRPAVQAATRAATARVMGTAAVIDAVAMGVLRDVANGHCLRLLRHLFARARAAHAEQRKHANEKEATQNAHQKYSADWMPVMITHRWTVIKLRTPATGQNNSDNES